MISFFLTLKRFLTGVGHAFKSDASKSLIFLLTILLLSGTFFYSSTEGFSYLDALYYSITILTTVGGSGLLVTTTFGKIFSIIYMLAGIGVTFGVIISIAMGIFKEFTEKDEKEDKKDKKDTEKISTEKGV